jgi:hypothetical protein
VAVYDLSKVGEWEDIGSDEEGEQHVHETRTGAIHEGEDAVDSREDHEDDVRTSKKFSFQVAEFAVDKGLDLLVLVEVRLVESTSAPRRSRRPESLPQKVRRT